MKSKAPPQPLVETEPPDLQSRVAALTHQVRALRAELAAQKKERATEAELTGQLMARNAELEAAGKPPASRRKRDSRNVSVEAAAAKEIGDLRASLAEAQDRVEVAETRLRAEQEAATLLQDKLKVARVQLEELTRSAAGHESAMEQIRADNEGLRAYAAGLEVTLDEERASRASAISELKEDAEAMQAAMIALGRERDDATAKVAALEAELEGIRRDFGDERDGFQQLAADVTRDRDEARAALSTAEATVAALQKELDDDRQALQDAELGLGKERERVKAAHARIVELTAEQGGLFDARDAAVDERDAARAELAKAKGETAAAQAAAEQERARAEAADERLATLARKHEAVDKACTGLTAELERERLATQDAQLALSVQRDENHVLRTAVAELEKKAKTREKAHIDAIVRLRQEHDQAIAAAEAAHAAILEKSQEALRQTQDAHAKSENALVLAETELKAARKETAAALGTVGALQAKTQEMLEGVVGLSDSLEDVARREHELAEARAQSLRQAQTLLDQIVALEQAASTGIESSPDVELPPAPRSERAAPISLDGDWDPP